MHEASLYDMSSFVTLTYDDLNIDDKRSLVYTDFQKFMKRLRKHRGPTRFFVAGEYGSGLQRPHWHCALFGYWPADAKHWRKGASGHVLYRSAVLDRLWGMGHVEVGTLTFESAAYMARYVMEKVTGDLAEDHYRDVDSETGEVINRRPEFARMSLRPGIGHDWFIRYGARVLAHDNVIVNGHEAKPPRYYDVLMERVAPERLEELRFKRAERAKLSAAEGTDDRLRVREEVAKARLRFKKREL